MFMNASFNSINRLLDFLHNFEIVSGLSLNKHKCFFIASNKVSNARIVVINALTSFVQGQLTIKYLGIPLFKGGKKSFLFDDLITSVKNKLLSWDSNF
ncbi:hypothetical protein KFK09_007152 [Dendrobium nobile]|uniref:Reverse transcriptase n=1 Tax=Dendrobium nobile TaxID=94219 RepID=A0A8T3BR56_DENNO|nr:hypothetical protein KFK09_007152 [Dendrobium nobile]